MEKETMTGENMWVSSLREFKQLNVLAFCGIMGALSVALEFFGSISFGPFVKIGLTELPNLVVDFLFGPVAGAIFGGVMDIVKFVAKPDGAFFFGFTVTAMAAALIYGIILYRRKLTIWRVLAAEVLVKLVCNIGLNTIWLVMLYDKAIAAILPTRIVSNLLQLPVDTLAVFIVLQAAERINRSRYGLDRRENRNS